MKKTILTLSLILTIASSVTANAAQIVEGKFNTETNKVELTVAYGGGCSSHSFKLELADGCRESFPVQCDLELIHTSDQPDSCEAYIYQNLKLDLPEGILTDSYYTRASMTVFGDDDRVVTFRLPEIN